MRTPYVVSALLVLAPSVVFGQASEEWRARFAAGEEARLAGDTSAYATEMAAAAAAMPPDLLNRPFVQYHAARASAMHGDPAAAVSWLRRAWDEGIESLMISFAPFDPAFADMLHTADFRAVMELTAEMELTTRRLGGSVYLIDGTGANVVAQIGSDGVLLVDTGYRPALPALRSALATLGADGVDLLLITHAHEDHMGAAPDLGPGAVVLAHPETTAAMKEPYVSMDGVTLPPKTADALPDREVARDTTFRFNGESVRVVDTSAHTAGDLSIYFSEARVAHLGDTYLRGNPMMYPGTEDPDAYLDGLESFLDDVHPETVVVGGHERPVGVAEVRTQIERSRSCMAFVRASIADGLSMEETAERAGDDFAPQWVGFFYTLFTREPR